ncbi:class I SAM-dependent methyltransferase [Spirosoma fluviale]|uniref:Thiopurine S-methyltransferase (TPMT) n=1 Tax=Spirosoma fluviale TaxID=1597977 RepID=A0A286GMY8_9BACT|nr:class I SAM-dependent methyltransferase [Spirosoma fluviale]SOD96915.1 Thiopurine S-methyltransferase (TPMT) [Spirosoma fluviale]
MNEFWETRYSSPTYAYGTQPNEFFKQCIDTLPPGRVLLPAEGEGRNAVYAARQNWAVDAFDFSEAGRQKALQLAETFGIKFAYTIDTFAEIDVPENTYGLIGLIYAHMPSVERKVVHKRLISFLKPGGFVILEAFHKEQLGNPSGGPKDSDMLYNRTDLLEDFNELNILQLEEVYTDLNEGPFHHGSACVIRLVAKKK